MTKMRMICSNCSSDDVKRDAWAVWDEEKQDWVLENVFDNAFCADCDGECSIKDQPIKPTVKIPVIYRVNIREVHISTREVRGWRGDSREAIIQKALDSDDEVEMEYSHTLDSGNHTLEIVE